MEFAEMEYAIKTFQESHEQNLEYIVSLREEINELKAELEEAQADNEPSAFEKLDIPGIEL